MTTDLGPTPFDPQRKRTGRAPFGVFAFLLIPGSVLAAPALVQTNNAASGGNVSSITATFAAPPTAGNLLIAMAGNRSGTTVTSIPAGWSNAVQDPGSSPGHLVIYKIAAVGEPSGVTITYSSSTRLGLHIYEYTGLSGPAYREVQTNAGTGTSLASGTVTTTTNDELVVAGFVINVNTSFTSWSNTFTERNDFQNTGATSSQSTYGGAERVASTPGSYSTTATVGSSAAWKGHIARFSSSVSISGTVFEDVNYGGGAGRDSATAAGVGRSGARVELYNNAGVYVRSTTSQAGGAYSLAGLAAGNYTVRVVNDSVSSSRTGYTTSLKAVQTYRTNASSGTPVPVTDYVGGQNPAVADAGAGSAGATMNTTTGVFSAGPSGTAQSITNVTLSASNITDVDFGFNFDTIVNVNNAAQGSLRQFLLNSNALGGEASLAQAGFRKNLSGADEALPVGFESSIFMISDGLAHPGLRAGLTNLLDANGVAAIVPSTVLPAITGAQSSLDGTTQTKNVGNTNAAVLGTGGTVGVDALTLAQVAGPEVAIRDAAALTNGIQVQANGVTVRGIAIYGFGVAAPDAGILLNAGFTGSLIEGNVLGSAAHTFVDPGAALRNYISIHSDGADGGTIRNNLIGFTQLRGIWLTNTATGWTVTGNELKDNGLNSTSGDGLAINLSSTSTCSGNLITGTSSQGYVVTSSTGNTFTNNSVSGNGVGITSGNTESAGITMRSGASATLLDRNRVNANYGAGLQVNNDASGTRLTGNTFVGNGTITARNGGGATGQIGIDLNAPGDDINLGTPPFRTLNDAGDADAGGNALQNFPVLNSAATRGGQVAIAGSLNSSASTTFRLEFFASSAADPSGYGEADRYLGFLDVVTDGSGNAAFNVTLAATVIVGEAITATATDPSGNTSEFCAAISAVAPGITVSPTAGLVTTEAGGTATFTIVLVTQPTADVTIGLSSSDLTEGTVAPASLTFTAANWNTPQTVTATGVDDAVDDGDVAYTIVTASAVSTDLIYSGLDASDVAVTNTDNDVAGITVTPTAGLVTTEAGATATFTIVLDTQPTADVTIGLSSSDVTEGTVAPASLTFTAANWSTPQTVTATGVDDAVDDGDIAYTIVTAAAASADPNYSARNASDVAATNTDNDAAGITVTPTAGLVTTEAGATATFTIALDTQPTADVTIGLSSSDVTEGTVAPASLTFTAANWNTPQTVTATGVDDLVDDADIVYTIVTAAAASADPNYSGRNASDVAATNTDNDVAGITVTPSAGLVTTEAGATATFTIALDTQPTADVTIGLSSSDLTEGTVAPASLTFTAANWSTPQTVTATGVDDAVDDGDIAYTIVTAAAASADPNYSGRNASDVAATNTDNDAAGITVTPTAGLVTTEAGATATFTIVLDTQPTADATIGLSSSDVTEGTVAPASLTFTAANWNTPQTVTATGVDDAVDDADIVYTIVTAAAASADPNYSGRNASDVAATNTDNDAAGITVTPSAGLVTTEAGATAAFTIVLDTQPTADVTIGLSSSDVTEGTVAPASLTFTAANWSTPQTVTATGVDDAVDDGDIAYTIVTAAAASADPNHSGRNASDVAATNTDNDAAGITVTPTAGLVTTEAAATATFTIALDTQPTADVTIGLSSSDLTEGTVAPASLTFTAANWSTPQTVTATGVDDAVDDGDVPYTLVTAAAVSSDLPYSGLNPSNVAATNTDNDAAGITVMPAAGLVTTEAGGTATFTVVLNSQPAANVTVGLSSSDLTEGTVAPASLTFTAANWNTPQTVTATGANDALADGDIEYTIVTAAAASADPGYSGSNASDVSVTNTDNDAAGITVTPTTGLVTTEAGGTATFTIVLDTQPTADVTIGLTSSDLTEGVVVPGSVTFTAANWNAPRTVTITGVNDVIDDGDIAFTIVTAAAVSADPGYSGRNASDVSVTNTDDDAAGITVTPSAGLVTSEAGGTATLTVALNSQPTADVTIGLSSSDLTEATVAPASLTFTGANWNVPQTVTATGADDLVADGDIAYTIVTAAAVSADPAYGGSNASDVAATNTDNETPGITVSPTAGLVTTEAGATASFTVVLNSQPIADVAIALSSSDLTEGTVAPASLTFTGVNWSTPQTVTVTGVNDAIDDGDTPYSILTAAAVSTDPGYSGRNASDVSVTNTDNDAAGITVAPTAGLVTTEAGGTAAFTIVLDTQPTADVTIGHSSSDATEATVAPASLTFTTANWNTPQAVTASGVDDLIDDGNIAYTIVTAAATSADPNYDTRNASDVSLSNTDNDAAGITVNPTAGLTTTEAGGTATFTMVLNSQPTADVTLGLSSSDAGEGSVLPTSLTFTLLNWNIARTVTVTGVDDAIADGDIAYLVVTAPAVSTDPGYSGLDASDVSVVNIGDDVAGITVAPVTGLTTTEGGGTATFTVELASQPTADVTVGLSSSDATEGTIALVSVTFDAGDWNVPHVVTVTGVDDAVDDGDIPYTIVTAAAVSADPVYASMNAANVAVTNTDDDIAGVTVIPSVGLTTTEAGGATTFDVVLNTMPTADVVLGLSASDLTEGTVAPASLTFTAANWNIVRTVTVTGVDDAMDDGDVPYTIVTAAMVSADPNYSGMNATDVTVTNSDDDAAGISVTPIVGLMTTEAGGTATFDVVLASQPTNDVTVTLSSSDLTEGTVGPGALTFTAANWNAVRTVTVTGVDDALDDGNVAYTIVTTAATSVDPVYDGINAADVAVANSDDDAAGIMVTPTAGLVTTEAGGAATFDVVLASQPTDDVTVGVSSSDLTEGTVAPASLTFTAANWNAAQTVTVSGVDDAVDDGNIPYTIVIAAAVSTDPGYSGTNAADVTVNNTDDDVAGISVAPVVGLVTTEAGGSAAFDVVLDTEPTADVIIGISSSDLTEGAAAPASLTFTAANWNAAQTVTVTGVNDALDDGDIAFTIATAAAASADPNYAGMDAADVAATNTDDDAAGVVVTPTAGLVTTEVGGAATFDVVLATQPTADVALGLSSSDLTEGTSTPASLSFTSANWNTPQTVTVTGVNDVVDDGDIAYAIVTAAAVSADPNYSGTDPADVAVTNSDEDAAGISVTPATGLVTTEAGGSATFDLVLDTQPSADVTVGVSSSNLAEGSPAPASLTFTAANWNTAQTVTVTGVDDAIDDGDIGYTIVTAAAVSADPNYSGVNAADVTATNTDDDAAGISVTPAAGLVTTEAGGTATFDLVLITEPRADVTIGLTSSDLTEGTVAPASVTFTAANWNVAQTVTVTGVNDDIDDSNVTYAIVTAAASSADPSYNTLNAADATVTNTNDDAAGISVTPTAGLVTPEAGGTATFDVVLDTQPVADVTIGLSSSDPTEGVVAPVSLTFTGANWNTPQTVTVTGVDDALDDGDVAFTVLTAAAASSDPVYSGIDPADVAATSVDDDAAVVVVTPMSGLVTTEAGGTAAFDVVLGTEPTADVSIGLSSSDPTEATVTPASLTFTAANWNTPQTVTVTGVDDQVDDGDIAYTIVTAAAVSADPSYGGRDVPDVTAATSDDDAAGISVTPTVGLVTNEAGGSATFTVVLTTQPIADVTIGLSSSDLSEGVVAPGSLTFRSTDWNVAQTVTVSGADDAIDDGNIAYAVVTAPAVSADPNYDTTNAPDVAVTNGDDDAAGIAVAPTAGLGTTEAGGTATFDVVLGTEPVADVTIGLSSSDLTEGTVAPSSLTFTAANWNVAQRVTVTGVDDPFDDGDIAFTIVTAAATSADPAYNGSNAADVGVTNADDDLGTTASAVAEMSPTLVAAWNPGVAFQIDLAPTFAPTDAPLDRFEILLPPGFTNSVVESVSVTAVAQTAACPTPGAGRYCPTVTGGVIAVTLGTPVTVDGTRITVRFRADVPGVEGSFVTGVRVISAAGPRDAIAGDADGDASDGNTLTFRVRGVPDALGSSVTANPFVVVADGVAASIVTATLRNAAGQPLTGKRVTFTTDRGADDIVTQPLGLTGANGVATGSLRSARTGMSTITAFVETDSVTLGSRPTVAFTLGHQVELQLAADPEKAEVGQPVRFTLVVRNLAATPISGITTVATLPEQFRPIAGTTVRDGKPVADAAGEENRSIALDSLDVWEDRDGDGRASAGEPGVTVLGWQLVAGAGAVSGRYVSSAIAVDVCPACEVSNRAEAVVRVVESELFGSGTIVGRVFEDADGNGRLGGGERGVAGAMVALDDGTYALTDANGLYHLAPVEAGQRLLKINPGTVPQPARWTTRDAQIVTVTRGGMAKANFGVAVMRDTVRIETPPQPGVRIIAEMNALPIDVRGNISQRKLVVNGVKVEVPPRARGRAAIASSSVTVNDSAVTVDGQGRFATRLLEFKGDRIEVRMGRASEESTLILHLPKLKVDYPTGETRLFYGGAHGGFRVLAADSSKRARSMTLASEESGGGTAPVAEWMLVGHTDPGSTVRLDGRPIAVGEDGTFRNAVTLNRGENVFGLQVRAPSGALRLANVLMTVNDRDETGAPVAVATRAPALSVELPPRGVRLRAGTLLIPGRTEPGAELTVNGEKVALRADGSFDAHVRVPEGRSALVVESARPQGEVTRVEREVDADRQGLFLMMLADGVVGSLEGSGSLDGATDTQKEGFFAEGRIAYYLKGYVKGRFLVTSAFDSHQRPLHDLFRGLDEDDHQRLVRNLDPDRLYPVYGDSSTTVHDAQSQGRFYLGVQSEDLQVTVGNAALTLEGSELGGYRRTLYGARAQYRSLSRTRFGDPVTQVTVVGAEERQQHVRDELRGTGGSVFYLSHRDIIEGSEQVALAVRDQHTGLVRVRIPQRRNLDYTIKYEQGRLLFSRPISSVVEQAGLVDGALLSGHALHIEVDYEVRLDALDQAALASEVQQRLGSHVGLGGTYIRDPRAGSAYELSGGNAELKLSAGTRLVGEFAVARGSDTQVQTSTDGGLSFARAAHGSASEGSAWKGTVEIDAGEWWGAPGAVKLGTYARRIESGFHSGANARDRGTEKLGGHLDLRTGWAGAFSLRHDRERRDGNPGAGIAGESGITSALWARDAKRWGIATEYQGRVVTDSAGTSVERADLGAARLWGRLGERFTARLEQQGTFSGTRNDQTTLGLQFQMLDRLGLEASGTRGTLGRSLRGGATLTLGGGQIYVREQATAQGSRATRTTVFGASAPLGPMSRVYSEYQWEATGSEGRNSSLIGAEQSWRAGKALELSLSAEHSGTQNPTSDAQRTALSGSARFTHPAGIEATTRDEVRLESGAHDRVQVVTNNRLSVQLRAGFTALAHYRSGITRDRTLGRDEARFLETGLGLAFRPLTNDRLHLLVRTGRVSDRPVTLAGAPDPGRNTLDVTAIEGSMEFAPGLQWSTKLAERAHRNDSSPAPAPRIGSVLTVNRIDWRFYGPLGTGVEHRLQSLRAAGNRRGGWVNELHWEAARNLRLGAGYSFTRVSDDEFAYMNQSARGWFMRLQGRY